MTQHFLNSAKLRDLPMEEITNLTEEQAYQYFGDLRWGHPGKQICPSCGVIDAHYWNRYRKQWRCKHKGCQYDFSATHDTCFQNHKLPIKKILLAIYHYIMNWKGCAAQVLARYIDVSYRTAWLLLSKIRELLFKNRDMSPLNGTVHVDGAYFGGKRRDANKRRANPKERAEGIQGAVYAKHGAALSGRQRRAKHLVPGGKANAKRKLNRRVVMVLREVSNNHGEGAMKTRVTISRREHESDAIPFIKKYVESGSTVMSDENAAYNQLSFTYVHKTVQHYVEYQTKDGVSNNQAESFNSRMRRAEYGVYHGYRPTYLMLYACETAWQEDNRKKTLRERFNLIFSYIAKSGKSENFRRYWQGHRLQYEILNE